MYTYSFRNYILQNSNKYSQSYISCIVRTYLLLILKLYSSPKMYYGRYDAFHVYFLKIKTLKLKSHKNVTCDFSTHSRMNIRYDIIHIWPCLLNPFPVSITSCWINPCVLYSCISPSRYNSVILLNNKKKKKNARESL